MASRRSRGSERPEPARLLARRSEVEREIDERIEKGRQLLDMPIRTHEEYEQIRSRYYTWSDFNYELLRRRFSTPEIADEYRSTGAIVISGYEESLADYLEGLHRDIRDKLQALESVSERLRIIEEPTASAADQPIIRPRLQGNTLFVVHGRNEAAKQQVQTFLSRVTNRQVQVLHEQADQGKTLIEKFERHAEQAAYAVVLLTADDEGRLKGEERLSDRARQNVVFELGFFFGSHGRERVAVLLERGVEKPTDIDGLLYILIDEDGAWKLGLAKELRAAGIEVDMNKAI